MASLADEIFLNLPWSGRSAWQANLLEARLFQSHRAGEEIFQRIDRLLLDQDPAQRPLAELYLAALALGFQGKFRGRAEGPQALETYRRHLYQALERRDPIVLEGRQRLCPEAYAGLLDQGRPRRLPLLRSTWIALGALLLVWLLASHFLWRDLIAEMAEIITRVLALP
jgi:type VI secretion system protein ImpK